MYSPTSQITNSGGFKSLYINKKSSVLTPLTQIRKKPLIGKRTWKKLKQPFPRTVRDAIDVVWPEHRLQNYSMQNRITKWWWIYNIDEEWSLESYFLVKSCSILTAWYSVLHHQNHKKDCIMCRHVDNRILFFLLLVSADVLFFITCWQSRFSCVISH